MTYVNVGAFISFHRPRSKKELREAIQNTPGLVRFDRTSIFESGDIWLDDFPQGATLSITGPCPYTARKWYATLAKSGDKFVLK